MRVFFYCQKPTQPFTLAERDKQLEERKKSAGDNAALQEQITKLQGENKVPAEKYASELKEIRLCTAIKLALSSEVHDLDIVAGLLDKSKIELGDSGGKTGKPNVSIPRLKFPDHYVKVAITVDDTGITANSDGRKIVPAGTIIGNGILTDPTKKAKKAVTFFNEEKIQFEIERLSERKTII